METSQELKKFENLSIAKMGRDLIKMMIMPKLQFISYLKGKRGLKDFEKAWRGSMVILNGNIGYKKP